MSTKPKTRTATATPTFPGPRIVLRRNGCSIPALCEITGEEQDSPELEFYLVNEAGMAVGSVSESAALAIGFTVDPETWEEIKVAYGTAAHGELLGARSEELKRDAARLTDDLKDRGDTMRASWGAALRVHAAMRSRGSAKTAN